MEKRDEQSRETQLLRERWREISVVALRTVTGMQSTYRVYGNRRNDPDVQIHKHMCRCVLVPISVLPNKGRACESTMIQIATYWLSSTGLLCYVFLKHAMYNRFERF